jgi:1-acyl-sn-glycerol-3-phosphate acyltransferase
VPASHYDHAHFQRRRRFLRFLIRTIGFTILARVDKVEGIENIPTQGPAILMINHIAFVDSIVVLHLTPRNLVPLAKVEVYNYPIIGIFPHMWGVIPVRREEVDRQAIQGALDVLRAGEIILVAPEARRGPQLKQGKEGVAYLASRSGAPIVPIAIEGSEGFPSLPFLARWRGPGIHVQYGPPFRYRGSPMRADREQVHHMTEEAMYILAKMLPEHRRGFYADLSRATQDTIEWL